MSGAPSQTAQPVRTSSGDGGDVEHARGVMPGHVAHFVPTGPEGHRGPSGAPRREDALPVPAAHERDASPRLRDSSILPFDPVGRVPSPSAGSRSTPSRGQRSGVRHHRRPGRAELWRAQLARRPSSIAWPIIESPASETRTPTVVPGSLGTARETTPCAPLPAESLGSLASAMTAAAPTTRATPAIAEAVSSPGASRGAHEVLRSRLDDACTCPRRSPRGRTLIQDAHAVRGNRRSCLSTRRWSGVPAGISPVIQQGDDDQASAPQNARPWRPS